MIERIRRQTDDIVRCYGELDRRVASTGMEGIAGLLIVSQHVEAALALVSSRELDGMVREVRAVVERLVRIDSELQRIRTLKTLLATDDATS